MINPSKLFTILTTLALLLILHNSVYASTPAPTDNPIFIPINPLGTPAQNMPATITPTPLPGDLGTIQINNSPLNPASNPEGIRTQFNTLVSTLLGWATIIGALFFLIQIFLGGYAFMTAGGDTGKVAEGRQRIINGLIGLIIVVSAYAIAGLIANLLQIPIYNPLVDELFLSPLTPTPAP